MPTIGFRADVIVPFTKLGHYDDFDIAAELDSDNPGLVADWRLMRDGEVYGCDHHLARLIQSEVDTYQVEAFGWDRELEYRREAAAERAAEGMCL
jgi:hypothetical protein